MIIIAKWDSWIMLYGHSRYFILKFECSMQTEFNFTPPFKKFSTLGERKTGFCIFTNRLGLGSRFDTMEDESNALLVISGSEVRGLDSNERVH